MKACFFTRTGPTALIQNKQIERGMCTWSVYISSLWWTYLYSRQTDPAVSVLRWQLMLQKWHLVDDFEWALFLQPINNSAITSNRKNKMKPGSVENNEILGFHCSSHWVIDCKHRIVGNFHCPVLWRVYQLTYFLKLRYSWDCLI
jgi:hypothetical protein